MPDIPITAISHLFNKMDDKLRELMPEEEYKAFMKDASREALRADIEAMDDGPQKEFCIQKFEKLMDFADDLFPSPWD